MRKSAAIAGPLIVIAAAIFFLFPHGAAADNLGGINLTTSPVATTLVSQPGTPASTTLHIQNNTAAAETINIELETFKAYGTSGAAQMMPFPKNDPSAGWVHFSQTSFVAQPGVWNSIEMTVNLPANAGLGYYYAVVFKPQVTALQKLVGSSVKGGNAILVLVNANNGNERPNIAITKFSVDKKLYEYLPVNFSITVKNTGNIFLAPTGDIYISRTDNFANALATLSVNQDEGNVLTQSSRVFMQQWSDGFPVFVPKTVDGEKITNKNGQIEQTLQWNFADANKIRFGKYYANLVMVYNNGSRDVPIEASVAFWVIPWKILSIVIIVLILVCIGLFASGRRLAARTVKLSKKVKSRKHVDA